MNNIFIYQIFSIEFFIIHFKRSKNLRFLHFPSRNKPKSGAKIVINTNSQNRKGIFFAHECNFLVIYIYKVSSSTLFTRKGSDDEDNEKIIVFLFDNLNYFVSLQR